MVNIDSDQYAKHGQYNGDGQLRGLIVQSLRKSIFFKTQQWTTYPELCIVALEI